jgi:biopolymer transport protein ExbD
MTHLRKSATTFFLLAAAVFAVVCVRAVALDSQQPQKGISVDLARTVNAKPMPAADDANAWIISISADGRIWFGTIPLTAEALADKMIQTPRNRDQNLYIKADARAPYFDVLNSLKAAQVAGLDAPIFLTAQHTSPQAHGLTPPMGLQVWIENGALAGPTKPIDVDIAASHGSPEVKVNSRSVSWTDLQDAIKRLSQNQIESTVRLNADGEVPFNEVVRAIDAARSAGAKVVLVMPKL